MRENRINWPQFFRPVCVLCMACGGLWLWWQMSLTENLLGRITAIAGVVLSALYLICCNASTAIGDDGDAKEQPDYSELHPYWENMEKVKREWEQNTSAKAKEKEEN